MSELRHTKIQLKDEIDQNQTMKTQFESDKVRIQKLFDHKNAEMDRVVSEIEAFRSNTAQVEERLAAQSAAQSFAVADVGAQRSSGDAIHLSSAVPSPVELGWNPSCQPLRVCRAE